MRIELPAVVWTLTKGERVARCEVHEHPVGRELRCTVDGELVQARAFRDMEALKLEAFTWQDGFEALGWRPAST